MGTCPSQLEKFKFQKGQKAWNFDSLEKPCPICGRVVLIPRSHADKRTCCSKKCAGKLKTKKARDAVQGRTHKICFRCKEKFAITEFHRNKQKPDGRHPVCKTCHHKHNMEMISKNREHYRKRQRDYMRKHRIGQNGKDFLKVQNKRDYPTNEQCEICRDSHPKRLVYHHWDDADFSKGMWICTKCHIAAHWLEKYSPDLFYNLKDRINQVSLQ